MMQRLLERGRALAEARRKTFVARLTAAMRDDMPRGVTVEATDEGVALAGRRLVARSFRDARLRGFAALARTLGGGA